MPPTDITGLADALVKRGLKHAFGVTGSGASMALILELERKGVAYHGVAHEAAAAMMAGTLARVSGRPAISISIKGPGIVNMVPGIAFNHFENNPAISISESFGPKAPSHRMHKRLDHPALLSSITKAVAGMGDGEAAIEGLLDLALTEAPGPVHIDLDNLSGSAPPKSAGRALESVSVQVPQGARRPVVIAGSLAARRGWGAALAALTLPVFTTAAAKGLVDENSPFSAGVFTGAGGELAPETAVLQAADLVVGIGLRNTEVLRADPLVSGSILVDSVNGSYTDGFASKQVVTDDAGVLGLLESLQRFEWGAGEIADSLDSLRAELSGGWLPGDCFEAMNALAWNHDMVLDTGSFCTVGEHVWRASKERPFWGSSNGRFMGSAIPMAVGAALARPGLPLVCVMGDGGVRPYGAEIAVAVEAALPICFLLMSDGRYGSVAGALRPGNYSENAVSVARRSWPEMAEAMGCPAQVVGSASELGSALAAWSRSGPLFLETRFDPDQYAAMTKRVRS
jgi:acetolactate synthase-1/2/3 large subunit